MTKVILKTFFMIGTEHTYGDQCEFVNQGQRVFYYMTSVDFTAQTYTQTCPGASALHLQCFWWMQVIQLCPNMFVLVYPYCSKA